jgi:hypothetical protein
MDDAGEHLAPEYVIAVPLRKSDLNRMLVAMGVNADLLVTHLRVTELSGADGLAEATHDLLLSASEFAGMCLTMVACLATSCSPVTNRPNYTAVQALQATVMSYTRDIGALSTFSIAVDDDISAANLTRYDNVKKRIKLGKMQQEKATKRGKAEPDLFQLRSDRLDDIETSCTRDFKHLEHLERVTSSSTIPAVRAMLWAMGRVLLPDVVTWDEDIYGQRPTEIPVLRTLIAKIEAQEYRSIDTLYHKGHGTN